MTIFGKQNASTKHTKDNELTPYVSARLGTYREIKDQKSTIKMWQISTLTCLLVALVAVAGNIHLGSQSKYVPYIVEVDKLGRVQGVSALAASATADPRVIKTTIANIVTDARNVSYDPMIQRKSILSLYAHLNSKDASTNKMNEYLNGSQETNPFVRAKKETVEVNIESVIQQSIGTWQVDWVETVRDKKGMQKEPPYHMRGLFTIYQSAPSPSTQEDQMLKNPLGIYIKDFSWSKQI